MRWSPQPECCWGKVVSSWTTIARRIRVPSGFVIAGLYVWLAKPAARSIVVGALIVVGGLLVRGWASGHLRKNEQLATGGPYAYTRNPLYLGSLILALGFAVAAKSLWIVLLLAVAFAAIYVPVMRAEESYLSQQFPEFGEYACRVPRFIPKLSKINGPAGIFTWELYWKHREYNATLGSLVIMGALIVKLLWMAR
jgi:protein-S-isoprenylcysteine O-methyltransferase Ste14